MNKNNEFFTTENPDVVLGEIVTYLEEKGWTSKCSEDKYKIKAEILSETHAPIELSIQILKAGDGKYCVEFQKTGGDKLDFLKVYQTMKDELDLEDTFY